MYGKPGWYAVRVPSRVSTINRSRVFAALSDPTRLRVVDLLASEDELAGAEIGKRLGISLALCCHHLRILEESHVIRKRKEGQTTYCSLIRSVVTRAVKDLVEESSS
jgi:DNA-binding transcriptional ArsR family regulator